MRKIMKSRSIAVILTILIFVTSLSWDMMTVSAAKEDVTETIEETAEETVAETDSVSDGDEDPEMISEDGLALPEDEPEELDYVLGRPMTEDEIAQQKAIYAQYVGKGGYQEDFPRTNDISLSAENPISMATYPTTYDSRNVNGKSYITSVKNQGQYGTCWAHASIACVESNMIKNGMANTSLDLSEAHMVYYTTFSAKDPLENDGEDNGYGIGEYWMEGNNSIFAAGSLMNWKGPVSESTVPYSKVTESLGQKNISLAYGQDVAHLDGWYAMEATDRNAIKNAVMEYGSVEVAYKVDDYFYNYNTAAYYNNNENWGDAHAVLVVGWDDNYKKDNFNSNARPSANGAWLIKNSWGTDWGLNGYFWMSYEDASLGGACTFDMTAANNYQNNYQYDHSNGKGSVFGRKVANLFTAKANPGKQEDLKAVSIMVDDSEVEYSVQIYKNLRNYNDPTSGEACLTTPPSGKFTYAGYHTVELPKAVRLNDGDVFAVVFTLSKADGGAVIVGTEGAAPYGSTGGKASAERFQSYVMYSTTWQDNVQYGMGENLKIKAYTDNVNSASTTVKVTGISIDKSNVTLDPGKKVTLKATISPSNATNKDVVWSSSKEYVATVDANGVITAKTGGTATISAHSVNGNFTAKCVVTVTGGTPYLTIMYPSSSMTVGEQMEPILVDAYPGDTKIKFSSSAPNVIGVNESTGELTAYRDGNVVITATGSNGKTGTANINAQKPLNSYIGDVNTELYSIDLKQNAQGAYYLTGEIVVVEWVGGVSTVPEYAPTMTFKSTDGKEEIEVFVTAVGTNTYYFDRFIEGLSPNKEYVFEVASGNPRNCSAYRAVNVNIETSPRMPEMKNVGRTGTQKISYYTGANGDMILYPRSGKYAAAINSQLMTASCTSNNIGNFVTGEVVVVEWEIGKKSGKPVSMVPFETPEVRFHSTDGTVDMDCFIQLPQGTNTYYFDRCLEDLDPKKQYYFTIASSDKNNTSPNKSMIMTTSDMPQKSGDLWETAKQYVKYKTNPNNGQMIIYAVNK